MTRKNSFNMTRKKYFTSIVSAVVAIQLAQSLQFIMEKGRADLFQEGTAVLGTGE